MLRTPADRFCYTIGSVINKLPLRANERLEMANWGAGFIAIEQIQVYPNGTIISLIEVKDNTHLLNIETVADQHASAWRPGVDYRH
jgi:hypothetical protein